MENILGQGALLQEQVLPWTEGKRVLPQSEYSESLYPITHRLYLVNGAMRSHYSLLDRYIILLTIVIRLYVHCCINYNIIKSHIANTHNKPHPSPVLAPSSHTRCIATNFEYSVPASSVDIKAFVEGISTSSQTLRRRYQQESDPYGDDEVVLNMYIA